MTSTSSWAARAMMMTGGNDVDVLLGRAATIIEGNDGYDPARRRGRYDSGATT
jgi:hypothetical protein